MRLLVIFHHSFTREIQSPVFASAPFDFKINRPLVELLVSGLYNAVTKIMAFELPPAYHMLVMVKLALGFVVFFIAALLSGRSEKAQKLREQEMKWLNILCASMLVLVLVAGYMKFLSDGAPVKDRTSNGSATSSVEQEIKLIVTSV